MQRLKQLFDFIFTPEERARLRWAAERLLLTYGTFRVEFGTCCPLTYVFGHDGALEKAIGDGPGYEFTLSFDHEAKSYQRAKGCESYAEAASAIVLELTGMDLEVAA